MQLPWRKPPAAMVRALSGWVATQSRRDHSPSKQGLSMSRRRLSLFPALLFLACASSALAESGRGQRAGVNASVKEIGRVEMWRGSSRFGLSVAAPFVWRCPSNLAITPFPHPAHRTGRADLPHPALGQDVTPSPTPRRAPAHSVESIHSGRRDARVDRSRPVYA